MFDFVRKHTKIMQFVLFLLILPSFVLFGLDGYSRFKEQGDAVAVVDGQEIRQSEWDNAHKAEVERMRQSAPSMDAKTFDTPTARYSTLERLVRDRVLTAASKGQRLAISDGKILREFQEDKALMSFVKDGKFDMEAFRQRVGAQGMSPEMFVDRMRQDMAFRQVLFGVADSAVNAKALSDQAVRALLERREVQVLRLSSADAMAKLSPTDEQAESFYKENPQMFQAPESATVEYLVLDLEAARKRVTLKPEEVKTYYEQNAARLAGQEERRASHILINAPKNVSASERAAAKAKAEALQAEAKKSPAGFAELAKKNSQDQGSAANGGDLDFFSRGAMVKPFEDAVFAMQKGEVSAVVETDFGYHVILLTDVKTPQQKTFEEAKAQVEADLIKQQSQKKFAELAEAFTNSVYEQSESLKPAADLLGLQTRTMANVIRNPGPQTTGPLANQRLLAALFSPESIEKKRNTEAIEVGKNQLVSARIVQYTPARTQALAEVKDKARIRVVEKQAAEIAQKEGLAKLAALQAAPATASANLPTAIVLARDKTENLPGPIIEAALRADPQKLPSLQGIDLGMIGYAIIRVNKVLPADTQDAQAQKTAEQGRVQVAKMWGSAESMAYYNTLKERFKAQIKVAKPVDKKEDSLAQ